MAQPKTMTGPGLQPGPGGPGGQGLGAGAGQQDLPVQAAEREYPPDLVAALHHVQAASTISRRQCRAGRPPLPCFHAGAGKAGSVTAHSASLMSVVVGLG